MASNNNNHNSGKSYYTGGGGRQYLNTVEGGSYDDERYRRSQYQYIHQQYQQQYDEQQQQQHGTTVNDTNTTNYLLNVANYRFIDGTDVTASAAGAGTGTIDYGYTEQRAAVPTNATAVAAAATIGHESDSDSAANDDDIDPPITDQDDEAKQAYATNNDTDHDNKVENDEEDDDDDSVNSKTPKNFIAVVNRGRTCVTPEILYKLSRGRCTYKDMLYCGMQYLYEMSLLQDRCFSRTTPRINRLCQCMLLFRKDPETNKYTDLHREVAKFMVFFGTKRRFDQQVIMIKWMKQTTLMKENIMQKNCIYSIPCVLESHDPTVPPMEWFVTDAPRICHGALLTILGKGREFYYTCKRAADTNTMPVHAAKGRRSNNGLYFDKHVADDLRLFFEELRSNYHTEEKYNRDGEVYYEINDPRVDSRRNLYRAFCWERGWNIQNRSTNDGSTETLPRDDPEWLALKQEPLHICARKTFEIFWSDNFPLLQMKPHLNGPKIHPTTSSSKKTKKDTAAATTTPATKRKRRKRNED